MSLLNALLELDRHAEGRRVEVKYLLLHISRLLEAITRELREGEHVTVDGRTYVVEKGRDEAAKVLTFNHGVLGARHQGAGLTYASLDDNQMFADHARKVVIAFSKHLQKHRSLLAKATESVMQATEEETP